MSHPDRDRAPRAFQPGWRAEILAAPPLIAPVRQHVYPQQIPGEEDALARGALRVMIFPVRGGPFLATCALGFSGGQLPSGVFACPCPEQVCVLAGGYAYVVDTRDPARFTFVGLRPVVQVLALPEAGLLVFVGHHRILAWGADGLAWESARLSWEGIRVVGSDAGTLKGFGWDINADRELAFAVDLCTGKHTGGAFPAAGS